ncbi:flagellar hook-length control protein FliK [Rhizobium grahamii]|uniref:Flagellar hook-length control protein FliK n=1 Tax=Rhizobium grahamii TaxID=1120045 RepID=A0A5Q0C0W1_9HYPH|nr:MULTISPECIES: flagellar hook-length control protein FliK [Rhizobium]QFY59083.1 flagellar hook-length control protein FliK [Rhizobium grahamii]QRM48397.1 flagellar hook-length control protein FliK [Rhizobium sp. BG6]
MVDISVSAGASGADAVTSGRPTGKGAADGNSGFSDVLNKAGGANRQDSGAASGQTANAQNPNDTAAVNANHRPTTRPVIDLDDASLAAQAEVQPETMKAIVVDKDTPKTGKADGKTGKRAASDKDAEADLKLGDEHETKASGKPAKSESKDAADDDSAASDVLSLLKQTQSNSATSILADASVLAGQKAAGGSTIDPKEKVTGERAKDDAIADIGALTAKTTSTDEVELPTDATDTTQQTFRLTRADNRGASMDMHLGIDTDAAEANGKASVDTVTVLDSRRFIGLAQNTNSAAVTAAISGDSEWAHAMQASSSLSNAAELSSTGKVVNTLKIQMNPIDLGLVTATLRLQGDALNVDLKVSTGAAYRQLKEDHGKMLEALRAQGYAVDSVTISMAPTPTSDAGQANTQNGGSQQQAFAQGQGGEAQERQNQQAQRNTGGFNDAGESGVEGASSGAAGGSSTGGVYL